MRRVAGPVHALSIEGSIGFERGEVSVGLRAVIARETDSGMEVLAGEIVGAKVVGLEAHVTAFDDVAFGRIIDDAAGISLLTDPSAPVAPAAVAPPAAPRPVLAPAPPPPPMRPAPPEPAAPAAQWADAITASAEADARPAAKVGSLGGAIPPRITRPQASHEETLFPEAGDTVEHFAFGTCEVLKSDGDRLFLRVGGKDGRIKEIAVEMLRVTPLESSGPGRRFKLDRKL